MAAVMKYISKTQSEMNETWEGVALSHLIIVIYILNMHLSHLLIVVFVAFANSCGTVLKFYFSVVRRVKYGLTPNIFFTPNIIK